MGRTRATRAVPVRGESAGRAWKRKRDRDRDRAVVRVQGHRSSLITAPSRTRGGGGGTGSSGAILRAAAFQERGNGACPARLV